MSTIKDVPIREVYIRELNLTTCTGAELTVYQLMESTTYDATSSTGTITRLLAETEDEQTTKLWFTTNHKED